MGRTDFGTGIGAITVAWSELLSRAYDVAIFDLHGRRTGTAALPTGRLVPLTDEPSGFGVYIYADVLWNGVSHSPYLAPSRDGLRVAHLAFDSDELPPEWVEILNRDFDTVLFTSPHLVDVAWRSGVRINIGALPVALDIDNQIAWPYAPPIGDKIRFGTVSAYHPRKGLEALVAAFVAEFADAPDAELVIHSNLSIGPTARAVRSLVERSGVSNVTMSTGNLSEEAKTELLATFDVFVNASQGEGYSIGVREALAQGKVVVATAVGAHADVLEAAGCFPVELGVRVPAIYPEIDSRWFGYQDLPDMGSLRAALSQAASFARSEEAEATAAARKRLGSRFGLTSLERAYWAAVDPDSVRLRPAGDPVSDALPEPHKEVARGHAGRSGARLGGRKLVVRAHDGGFFSLFNTYLSHLAWSIYDSPQRMVVPDWRASELLKHWPRPVSYCYSSPADGNLWNHLFEPPYGLSLADLDDDEFLSVGSEPAEPWFNESREPLLTYVNAFELYRSPQFGRIRRQYSDVLSAHIRLRPELQAEIDAFLRDHVGDRFMIAAHVKHPSHAVEQPGQRMASRDIFVDLVRDELRARGIDEGSDSWRVFPATEQERVLSLFRDEFGDHVVTFPEVERIPTAVDEEFDQLGESEKLVDGHQIQHIMAADTSRWSPRLAWEVYRDAYVMSRGSVLFHAVSNVATAAAFMNPTVEMRFVAA